MARVTDVSAEEKALLRDLLQQSSWPRDALPYSEEFPKLKEQFCQSVNREMSDHVFWLMLDGIGKEGGIAKPGERKKAPRSPRLSDGKQLEILRLMPDGIGIRDGLPYTPAFDRLHRKFTQLTETKLDKWDFWRVVLRLAKRSRKPKPVFDSVPLGSLPEQTVSVLEDANPWWLAKPAKRTFPYRRWAFEEVWRRLEDDGVPATAFSIPKKSPPAPFPA